MKQNKPYENELFKASRMLNAFTVEGEDYAVTVVLGLFDDIYQYDEEGLITHCTSAVEPLVDIFPKVFKIEVSPRVDKTQVFISLIGGVSNAEIDQLVEAFSGVLMEPIEEVSTIAGVVSNVEIMTEAMGNYYKIKKERK
jgi:hypothetical protein